MPDDHGGSYLSSPNAPGVADTLVAHIAAGSPIRFHGLLEHLEASETLARQFGASFGAADLAGLAARWHDLGKAHSSFQYMIRHENGLDAHIEKSAGTGTGTPRNHSSAGAHFAFHSASGGDEARFIAASCIAGHHAGLANLDKFKERLLRGEKLVQQVASALVETAVLKTASCTLPSWVRPFASDAGRHDVEMLTRFVFSALCDADFLDTEHFFAPERASLRARDETIAELGALLSAFLSHLEASAPVTEVNRTRSEVREYCVGAAALSPGFFSLTVPTGGGKTLASMAFALEHAQRHGLERVIVVIPFTSIIEQNAEVYRRVFGEDVVIEHHSALDPTDPSRETPRSRVASENWDARIVVTTTVQFFESLFAKRSSACRKLHRMARSVIVLDEAQTFPPRLLRPVLSALDFLVRAAGASIVISTATQPALSDPQHDALALTNVREIVPQSARLFDRLKRVRVEWPKMLDQPTPYAELAERIAEHEDVLVVVHRRADARALCRELDRILGHDKTVHLSALMCPAHRTEVLERLRKGRAEGVAARVVSTQLVEAGVDLDFPVVYRALAGVDSIAQAAGRCNREGRLGEGVVKVYVAETKPPKGVPAQGAAITESLLRQADGDLSLDDPTVFTRYFRSLYGVTGCDQKAIQDARRDFRFDDVAKGFRMIENDWSAPMVVHFGDGGSWVARLQTAGASREVLRALQRFSVSVAARSRDEWLARSDASDVEGVVVLHAASAAYDARFGLVPELVGVDDPATLVVNGPASSAVEE